MAINYKKYALFLSLLFVGFDLYNTESDECPPSNKVCEYWFEIKEKLTMIYGKDLVYAEKGKLYKYDEDPSNYTTEVPIEKVVTVDGVNRMTIAVNESVPGPPIIVYEGQKVIVHVKNLLLSDSTTIHWHGLHQKGTPWMDGVGWISQCPIGSGQSFTYEFEAKPKGTFWYHSHVGAQRSNGLYGAFIIKEKPKANVVLPEERIMMIGDWHHESSEEVYTKMVYGNFDGRIPYVPTKTIDGGRFSGVPWVSALINGKGRYNNPKTGIIVEAPLTQYNVTKGSQYRFRVIQVGTIYPLRVSVDNHNITVISSDGYDVQPREVESVILNPGERYDFLLHADQPVGNYWIRTVSMEANVNNHSAEAILHYDGAPNTEPTTTRRQCTQNYPCEVINCPFKYFPEGYNMECTLLSELQSAQNDDPAPKFEKDSEEYFLNFAFPGDKKTPGAVNGRKFEFPGVNSLTQHDEIGNYSCDKHDCGVDKVCYCHFELAIPYGKTIQMVWINMGVGAGWGHPIHMHGHSFHVLKMAYPPQNRTTSQITEEKNHVDIDCGGGKNFCNDAKWRNQSWNNGNIPGLNLKNPPRKDTIIIPTGGYAVLRFRSDNPGKWFIHCHIEVHALDGMAMVMTEALDKLPDPPKGFPICQNFYNDKSRDFYFINQDEIEECKEDEELKFFMIMCYILVGVCVVLLLVNIVTCISRRKLRHKIGTVKVTSPLVIHNDPSQRQTYT